MDAGHAHLNSRRCDGLTHGWSPAIPMVGHQPSPWLVARHTHGWSPVTINSIEELKRRAREKERNSAGIDLMGVGFFFCE